MLLTAIIRFFNWLFGVKKAKAEYVFGAYLLVKYAPRKNSQLDQTTMKEKSDATKNSKLDYQKGDVIDVFEDTRVPGRMTKLSSLWLKIPSTNYVEIAGVKYEKDVDGKSTGELFDERKEWNYLKEPVYNNPDDPDAGIKSHRAWKIDVDKLEQEGKLNLTNIKPKWEALVAARELKAKQEREGQSLYGDELIANQISGVNLAKDINAKLTDAQKDETPEIVIDKTYIVKR